MKLLRIPALLLVILALSSCGSSAVFMDYQIAGLWSNYRTYDWMPDPRPEDIGPMATNPVNRTSIEDAVDWALKNRGFRKDSENPDLLVAYYAGKKNAIDPSVWGYTYAPDGSYKDEQGPPMTFDGGTIVIDLVDAETKELMWRGWSPGVVESPNNDKMENSIREVVKRVMEQYPPR